LTSRCVWGALTTYPYKLRPFVSFRPGGATAPTALPGYAYEHMKHAK